MATDGVGNVYVADNLSHSVLVVDGAGSKQLGSIPVPGTASFGDIAVNSTTGLLYLATIQGTTANLLIIKDTMAGAVVQQQVLVDLTGTGAGTVTSVTPGTSEPSAQ